MQRNLGKTKFHVCKCEICDKVFKSKYSLVNHFNITHNLEKEYAYNICRKVFNIQSKLTLHVKIVHEKKKNYKCNSCGKSKVVFVL